MEDLLRADELPDPPAMAVQSGRGSLPAFVQENRLDLPPGVAPRIPIGNAFVALHYDAKENVAVWSGRAFCGLSARADCQSLSRAVRTDPGRYARQHGRYRRSRPGKTPALCRGGRPCGFGGAGAGRCDLHSYGWWHGVESLEAVSILVHW